MLQNLSKHKNFPVISSCLVIFIILILFFNKILFFRNIYVPGDFLRSDTLHQFLPFKYILKNALDNKGLPLWINDLYCGFPLLAEGQVGTFYPLQLVLYLIFPFLTAYNLTLFSTYLIAALGTYFYLKTKNFMNFTCIFAAISFSLGSFFIFHLTHQNIIFAACWLPLLFLLADTLIKNGLKKPVILLLAVLISVQFFAGSPQISFYSITSLIIYSILSALQNKQRFLFVVRNILLILSAVAIGFLLASIQLIPTLELVSNSPRSSGLANIALDSLPYHPRNLLTFINPYIFGDPGKGTYPHFGNSWGMFWENTGYVGIITLILALLSVFNLKSRKFSIFFWVLFLFSLFLSLGRYGPLFFIFKLPIFNFFRVPSRFLLVSSFALVVLAASTINDLFKKKPFNSQFFKSLFLLILVGDLFLTGYSYNPTYDFDQILKIPATVNFLRKNLLPDQRIYTIGAETIYDEINKEGWRSQREETIYHLNSLIADANILYGIPHGFGYSGLFQKDNFIFNQLINEGLIFKDRNILEVNDNSLKLFGMQRVAYIVSPFSLQNKALELVFQTNDFNFPNQYFIYKNPYVLPKALLVPDNINVISFPEKINLLQSLDFDPKKMIITDINFVMPEDKEASEEKDKLQITKREQGRIVFDIDSSKNQQVLITDNYYPGWKININGKIQDTEPADLMFTTFKVPKGKYKVEFFFKPQSYYLGRNITLITALFVTMGFAVWNKILFWRKIDSFFK